MNGGTEADGDGEEEEKIDTAESHADTSDACRRRGKVRWMKRKKIISIAMCMYVCVCSRAYEWN